MRKKNWFLFTAAVCGTCASLCAGDIVLPKPRTSGGEPLCSVLAGRRSVRLFDGRALSVQQLSDLLWAANGISRADGRRTAPSARNCQEIDLYVFLPSGVYFWDHKANLLKQRSSRDLRSAAGRMKAPAYLLIVADTKRAASAHYAAIDTGYVSQNIYLGAAAAGMGTCAVGQITDRKKIAAELKFGPEKVQMLSHPVGFPRKK